MPGGRKFSKITSKEAAKNIFWLFWPAVAEKGAGEHLLTTVFLAFSGAVWTESNFWGCEFGLIINYVLFHKKILI